MSRKPDTSTDTNVATLSRLAPIGGFVVVVALIWALFTYVVTNPGLVLEYVKALAWPAVAGATLFWVRRPIRDKLAHLLHVEGFGLTAQFARALEEDVRDSVDGILQPESRDEEAPDHPDNGDSTDEEAAADAVPLPEKHEPPHPADGHPQTTELPPTHGSTPAAPPTELVTTRHLRDLYSVAKYLDVDPRTPPDLEPAEARKALMTRITHAIRSSRRDSDRQQLVETQRNLEEVIRKSSAWGYRLGRSGADEVVPDVQWNNDGTWQITTGMPYTAHRARPTSTKNKLWQSVEPPSERYMFRIRTELGDASAVHQLRALGPQTVRASWPSNPKTRVHLERAADEEGVVLKFDPPNAPHRDF